MKPFNWSILYQDALRSEPENLLEQIRSATQCIIDRLHRMTFHETQLNVTEHRSLCLALSDLRVVRVSFVHSHPRRLRSETKREVPGS